MRYDTREEAGSIASDLLFVIIDILFGGFVTMVLWGWFISPTFNVHGLGLTQSIGLNIFISLFTARSNLGDDQFSRRVIFFLTWVRAVPIIWDRRLTRALVSTKRERGE